MPLLDYSTYTTLGYSAVPEAAFARCEGRAEAMLKYYLGGTPGGASGLTDAQRRGVCELTDLAAQAAKSGGQTLKGFSNGRYSESYAGRSADEMALAVIELYFAEELAEARVLATADEWAALKHDRGRF